MENITGDDGLSQAKRARLSQLAVSETGFVFDPQTGQSFSLNQTGMTALQLIKRGATSDKVARCLQDEYDVPFEVAVSSVEAFLLQLRRYM